MEEEQEDLGAGSPWVRTRYDEENQRWLWRVATDKEIARVVKAKKPVHKLEEN